jgi:nucleotide-binding universal stress UspA family protein
VDAPQAAEHYGPEADPLRYERGTDGPRVILVGVDGSPTSSHAAAYAVGLARRQRCRLVVVFVAPAAAFGAAIADVAGAMAATIEELETELREEVRRAANELGVPITFVKRLGDPFLQLREMADSVKADMVVVGVSTQAGHKIIGSIATKLVKLGRWPVVVVP